MTEIIFLVEDDPEGAMWQERSVSRFLLRLIAFQHYENRYAMPFIVIILMNTIVLGSSAYCQNLSRLKHDRRFQLPGFPIE